MNMPRTESKWWLAAYLVPIATVILCYALAVGTGGYEGVRYVVVGFIGASILSCLGAVVAFFRRERLAVLALFPAAVAVVFFLWLGVTYMNVQEAKIKREPDEIVYRKTEEDRHALIGRWRDTFIANPGLIADDEFWRTHSDVAHTAQWGMNWALQDKSFAVTPELKAYVIEHFPSEARLVFGSGRSSQEELLAITKDEKYSYEVREQALDCLLRDDTFDVQDDLKMIVFAEFPGKYTLLFGGTRFTKSELEGLVYNPKIADYVKRDAAQYLQWGRYKKEDQK